MAGPGTLRERFARIKSWGAEGVEAQPPVEVIDQPNPEETLQWEREVRNAMDATSLPVTSFCGGLRFHLLHPDADLRQADYERTCKCLAIAGRVGAKGIIVVPRFHSTPALPDLEPLKSSVELQKELLIAMLRKLAPVAEEAGAMIFLEPLNRYEAPWFHRLGQATEICEQVNSPAVCFMADFFHMNIEETDPPAAIRSNAKWLRHVHLADSTRAEPGTGLTDFGAGFAALAEIGFEGAAALECRVPEDADAAMSASVAFLKECRG
jgi:sugar phosphate isomerase/epimerase